ncbi:MAG TPA: hypothetical protein PKI62_14965, partial [bacterium]|nr:hypothetical protein [bacterium]
AGSTAPVPLRRFHCAGSTTPVPLRRLHCAGYTAPVPLRRLQRAGWPAGAVRLYLALDEIRVQRMRSRQGARQRSPAAAYFL